MTVTENDRIGLLKVIREEDVCVYNIMVISELAYVIIPSSIMLCIVGTAHIPLLSTPVFLLFYENLDKIYQEIPCFTPFFLPFPPLIFAFRMGEKCHRSHLFLLLRAFFSSFLSKKTILPFLPFLLG